MKGLHHELRPTIAAPIAVVAAGLLLTACGRGQLGLRHAPRSPRPRPRSPSAPRPPRPQPRLQPRRRAGGAGRRGRCLRLRSWSAPTATRCTPSPRTSTAVSTCFDACAAAWPAVTVTDGFAPPAGIDPALVTTVDRPDGSKQLKVGKWPLYFYAGDGAPGETNGQGVGGVWFVERPTEADQGGRRRPRRRRSTGRRASRRPSTEPAPEPEPPRRPAPAGPVVALAAVGNLGEVMVGANGHTLYAFTDDPEKQTTCFDACAAAWPPLTVRDGLHHLRRAAGRRCVPPSTGRTAPGSW